MFFFLGGFWNNFYFLKANKCITKTEKQKKQNQSCLQSQVVEFNTSSGSRTCTQHPLERDRNHTACTYCVLVHTLGIFTNSKPQSCMSILITKNTLHQLSLLGKYVILIFLETKICKRQKQQEALNTHLGWATGRCCTPRLPDLEDTQQRCTQALSLEFTLTLARHWLEGMLALTKRAVAQRESPWMVGSKEQIRHTSPSTSWNSPGTCDARCPRGAGLRYSFSVITKRHIQIISRPPLSVMHCHPVTSIQHRCKNELCPK